jgi:hypothetical protein
VLALNDVRALLASLRKQARAATRSSAVDSAALSAFVGALARLVHSPGPIPFSTAKFGAIRSLPSGEIVGDIVIDAGMSASLHDAGGVLAYAARPAGAEPSHSRKLTLAQLRALSGALRTRRGISSPPLDELWAKVLDDAVAQLAAASAALSAARGSAVPTGSAGEGRHGAVR